MYGVLGQGGVFTGNTNPADSFLVVSLLSLRGRRSKGKGKRILGKREVPSPSRQISSLLNDRDLWIRGRGRDLTGGKRDSCWGETTVHYGGFEIFVTLRVEVSFLRGFKCLRSRLCGLSFA